METHFSASLLLPELVLVGLTKSISYDIIHLPTNQKQRSGGKRDKRVPGHYKLDFIFLKKRFLVPGASPTIMLPRIWFGQDAIMSTSKHMTSASK
jgi:hypothetical protein